jgi:hypothetical protein
MRIFLGGTCADTTWRDELIKELDKLGIEYFNPVVENWTPECQAIEEDEKNNKCDCHLYVITKEMMGTYSIAEIINSTWQAVVYGTTVNFVIFAILDEGTWKKHEIKSFDATMNMVKNIAPYNSITCYVKNMKELSAYFSYLMNIELKSNKG